MKLFFCCSIQTLFCHCCAVGAPNAAGGRQQLHSHELLSGGWAHGHEDGLYLRHDQRCPEPCTIPYILEPLHHLSLFYLVGDLCQVLGSTDS